MIEQILRSSRNPEELSLTIKGLLLQLVPVVMALSVVFGATFDVSFLNELVEVIAKLVGTGASLVGLSMTLWGLVRKIWA